MMDCLCLPLPLSKTILPPNCFPRYLHYFDTVAMSALVNKTKSHPAASTRHTWLLSQCTWLPGKPSYRPEGFSKFIYHKKRNPDRRKRRQSAYGLGEPHISFSFTRSSWWRLNTLRFWEHVNITRSETAFSSYHKHTHRASCPNLTADRTFKFWMTLLKGIIWESGN